MKILIRYLLFLSILLPTRLRAQVSPPTALDSLTYRQFMNGETEALLEAVNLARQNRTDSYFANYRAGIVRFRAQQYAQSLAYFQSAYAQSKEDLDLQEYIYFALLWSGQSAQADIFAATCSPELQKRIGYEAKGLTQIQLGGGYLINQNNIEQVQTKLPTLTTPPDGEISIQQAMQFWGTSAVLSPTPNLSVAIGYQGFQTHPLLYYHSALSNYNNSRSNPQHQWNAGGRYQSAEGWFLGVWGGYYLNRSSLLQVQFDGTNETINTQDNQFKQYNLTFEMGTRYTFVQPQIQLSFHNLGNQSQVQAEFEATTYPLGNLKLYTQSNLAVKHLNQTPQLLFQQKIGMKALRKTWASVKFGLGNHLNYVGEQGFLSLNTFDPIHKIAGLEFSQYGKRVTFQLGYEWQEREGTFYALTNSGSTTLNYRYPNHLIKSSLICKI